MTCASASYIHTTDIEIILCPLTVGYVGYIPHPHSTHNTTSVVEVIKCCYLFISSINVSDIATCHTLLKERPSLIKSKFQQIPVTDLSCA